MKKCLSSLLCLCMCLALISSPEAGAQSAKSPFDYPVVTTAAKPGMFVLAPPRLWVDNAIKDGIKKQNFIFYAASMVTPGPGESKIKDLVGKEEVIPNSLIVPIRKGDKAKPGDVLLSWWQSGSGMQRAYVVKGGTAEQPKVMYLDMDYDNPSGCGKKVDTLKPDTFHKLKGPFEPGTAVAIKDGSSYNHGIVINVSGNKVLCNGHAGFMQVVDKARCIPVPVMMPGLKAGTEVMIPMFGTFKAGKVKKVDNAIGRVHVAYLFAGRESIALVAFGNVIKKLP